jgi:hypothetical protein
LLSRGHSTSCSTHWTWVSSSGESLHKSSSVMVSHGDAMMSDHFRQTSLLIQSRRDSAFLSSDKQCQSSRSWIISPPWLS